MNKNRRIAFLLAVLFCLSAVTFVAVAKYIKDVPYTGNVTFKADLAEKFTLTETKAVRQASGSYILSGEQVTQNSYILMPGVDVPKNPMVKIEGKTAVPAYLYVEVCPALPATVTYKIAKDYWTDLNITGPHGGKVYVYTSDLDGTVKVLDGTVENLTLPIIDKDTLYVSDKLDRGTTATMTFYGYMAQQVSGRDEKATFTNEFIPTP